MTLTDRDRKILLVLVPVALLVGYWFLLLAPKRDEVAKLDSQLETAQTALDSATALAAQADRTRAEFASDYATVVRLGKAVPATLDMPSLLVQLDSAAEGTKINFNRITAGARTPAGGAAAAPAPADGAQSAPGQAADAAQAKVDQANAGSQEAAQQSGEAPAAGAPAPSAAVTAPGLESVPLDFTFQGRFFDMADFFHDLKRFVYVGGDGDVVVRGRLVTIDSLTFSAPGTGGRLDVTVKATAFLAPKAEGVTAGATPSGPPPAAQTAGSDGGSPATPPAAARIP